MNNNVKPLYPNGPANRTDPIVRHDPSRKQSIVAKAYTPNKDNEYEGNNVFDDYSFIQQDGINIPIVKLNNYVIEANELEWMKIYYDKFVPYIDITVSDTLGEIQLRDVPGLDNVITVVMTMPVDGIYKKISIDFYITNVTFSNGFITYQAEYKSPELEKQQVMEVDFCPEDGCQAKECNLPYNPHPTTYEFLHECAKNCNFGFAATQHTKEINDDRYRILSSETFKSAIQRHTAFGGKSDKDIFDSWIDMFGYLVLVNVAWVMNENVDPSELAIVPIEGINTTEDKIDVIDASKALAHRLITNSNAMPVANNLMIASYENIVDTSSNFYTGTDNTFNIMQPVGNGGKNNIDIKKTEVVEQSVDGMNHKDNYRFSKIAFSGIEMNELNGTIYQKALHDNFFKRIRAKKLKVSLAAPNFGIERGTLISVVIFEYSLKNKRTIVANTASLFNDDSTEDKSNVPMDNLLDERRGMMNTALSGIYYVDGMDFEYDSISQQITQSLYLIKKGVIGNFSNSSVPIKLKS